MPGPSNQEGDSLVITLDDSIVGFWFVSIGPFQEEIGDYVTSVHKVEEGYALRSRMRIYVDDKTHDSADRKTWFEGKFDSKEEAIKAARIGCELIKKMPVEVHDPVELMRGEGTFEQFMEEFMALPFVHGRTISPEEAKKRGLDCHG